jgi:mRNA interferase RelE/StbE
MTIHKTIIGKIIEQIETLKLNPRPEGNKKLKGYASLYHIRQGHYRIICKVEDKKLIIEIIRVGYRKNIYQKRTN